MTSAINPTNIDIKYPIAGQDNDTQGFRDNFTIIKTNFSTAATEISTLQTQVYANSNVASYLSVATIDNFSAGNITVAHALQLANVTTTQRNALTVTNGALIYNNTFNKFQGYANGAWGNITLS
jgi:hypothetical protein